MQEASLAANVNKVAGSMLSGGSPFGGSKHVQQCKKMQFIQGEKSGLKA